MYFKHETMTVVDDDSDKKKKNKLADQAINAMYTGYSEIQKKDVYQFTNISAKQKNSANTIYGSFPQHMGLI
jgi:hypothetical protein